MIEAGSRGDLGFWEDVIVGIEKRVKIGRSLVVFFCVLVFGQQLVGCVAATVGIGSPTPHPAASIISAAASAKTKGEAKDKVTQKVSPPNFLSTAGSKIVDSTGKEVILTGINWFGMETGTFAPHGVWARNWEEMMDQIAALGFNTIRLPFSNEALDPKAIPTEGIDYDFNPDLEGLSGLQIMDKIIQGARDRGLKVILDRHRITKEAQSKLWYNEKYPEKRWIADWVMLAQRYKGNDTVIGADLHNEPAGDATWGTGDLKTDWRLAAERAGNAIHEVNPDWLIVVEGIEKLERDWYWMGGNLSRVRDFPVRLNVPNKLVYSPHDYGPGVFMQGWFQEKNFPENLPNVWDEHWGYIAREGIAPVLLGEFGGRSVGNDLEGRWQRKLLSYLKEHSISYTYWSFNPNSGDTGGVLKDDWFALDKAKAAMLAEFQFPLLGEAKIAAKPEAAEPKPYLMPVGPSGLKVAFKPSQPIERGSEAVMEFKIYNLSNTTYSLKDVELRYWLKDDRPNEEHALKVDWATVQKDKIVSQFVKQNDGNGYMKVTFKDGQLQGKSSAIDLKVRFLEADGGEHTFIDDWSFRPFKMMKDWDRVTLYIKGQLAWGKEPE